MQSKGAENHRLAGLSSFSAMLSGLVRTAGRFTLPLGCALAWAAIAIALKYGVNGGETELKGQLQVLFFLGFFWALAATLFAERRGWPALWHLLLGAAGLALLALRVVTGPQTLNPFTNPTVLLLGPGMVLLMMGAPFLSSRSDDAALWDFNRAGWVSAAFGLLVATIVGIGLSLAFGAVEVLLVELPNRVYTDTWILCMSVIWPWQALSGVPRGFQRPEGDFCPRWTAFLASYLLVPLASLYLAILYLYTAKILIQWELPKGQVGWLVGGYGTFGVATHLLAYPLRTSGNRLVRFYHRHFYHALFAPVALLVVAVGVRIGDYGITENRYCLLLFALWLAGMALIFTLRREPRLVVVPLSLAILLIAASFGPWGAIGLSTQSQLARLESLLAANQILIDGKVSRTEGPIGLADTKQVSSVVDYFWRSGKRSVLDTWLAEAGVAPAGDWNKTSIMAALGLDYVASWENSASFAYSSRPTDPVNVSDFDLLAWQVFTTSRTLELRDENSGETYVVAFNADAGTLSVGTGPDEQVTFDLKALVMGLGQAYSANDHAVNPDHMTETGRNGRLRVRISFETLNGTRLESVLRFTYAQAMILIGRVEAP